MKALARFGWMVWATLLVLSFEAVAQDEEQAELSQGELEQLVAPIALYPDPLLSQVLAASAYPLEVVQAARWSRDHPGQAGEAAVSAVADQDWDASVKALVAYPDILARMDQDLGWLQRLGDAAADQQAEVMDAVQSLRRKASTAGSLDHLDHVDVSRDDDDIALEPSSPDVAYVPYYDPAVVYGPWPWPAYPPYDWPPPPGYVVSAGVVWIGGVRVLPSFSTLYWPRRTLILVSHQPRPGVDFIWRHRNRIDYASVWRVDPRRRAGPLHRGRIVPLRPPYSRAPGFTPPGTRYPPRAGQPYVTPPGRSPDSDRRGYLPPGNRDRSGFPGGR